MIEQQSSPSTRYHVIVVELAGFRDRRNPKFPNVLVDITTVDPTIRVDQIRRGARPRWASPHVVRLRPDLMAKQHCDRRDDAKDEKKELINDLEQRGYTVNLRSTPVWSLYVVELDGKGRDDIGNGWLYVGETSKSPEDRLVQHKAGRKDDPSNPSSSKVHRYGQHLRTDLMRGLPTLFSQDDSKRAEFELAEQLRGRGYVVEGGH